ncbi:hypothetical protein RvY_06462 [Ramazzottius varieornatus]|uniref:Uncharacterized protein n=1 Tax=Ramazzottius varieornatus TaxID=947166 RepID=A0A1D1UYN4_RAMVA|nr:hypothetical protein RvY_06462 [Ramazzottius varieornatus]
MCESTFARNTGRRQQNEQFGAMRSTIGLSASTSEAVPASKTDYTSLTDLLVLLDDACSGYCTAKADDAIHRYLRNAANSAYFDRRTAKLELQAVKKIMSNDLFLLVVYVCKVKRRALDYEEFVQEHYPQLSKEERRMIGSFAKISQAPVDKLVFHQPYLREKAHPSVESSSEASSPTTLRSSLEDFISTPGFHPVSDLPKLYHHMARTINDLPDKDIFHSLLDIAANWNNECALRRMFPNYRGSTEARYWAVLNNHVSVSMNALKERLGPRVFPLVLNASRIRAQIPSCFCGKVYSSTFNLYKHHIRAWSSCLKTKREVGALEPDVISELATQINKRTFSATPQPDLQRVTTERILRLHKTSRAAERGLYLIDTFSVSFNTTEFIQAPPRDRSIYLLKFLQSRCQPQVQDVEELIEIFLDQETTVIIPWVLSSGNWLSESHTVILVLATQDEKRTFLRVDFDGSTMESDEHLAWFNQSFGILIHALQHQSAGLPKKLRHQCKLAWPNAEDAVDDRGVTLTREDNDDLWKNAAGMLNTIALCSFIAMMSEEAAVEDPVAALDEVLESVRLLCQQAKADKEVFETIVDLALLRPFVEAVKTQLQIKDSIP